MNIEKFISNTAEGFSKKRIVGYVVLYYIPLFLGILTQLFLDKIVLNFSIILTISSIFIGFYLTLLMSINSKIYTIDIKSIKKGVSKRYINRYLEYSQRFVSLIFYGFATIIFMIITSAVLNIEICLSVKFIIIKYYFLKVMFYISMYAFAISLIKIILILLEFFNEDFKEKVDQLNKLQFDEDDE